MNDLKITQDTNTGKGIAVLHLVGELDAHTFDDLDSALQELFGKNIFKIVLDMEKVGYISSAGIGTLVSSTMQCSDNGGNLVLIRVSDRLREVLSVLGLLEMLHYADDLQPALASF
jgi:anti-sigma B factor antagonist